MISVTTRQPQWATLDHTILTTIKLSQRRRKGVHTANLQQRLGTEKMCQHIDTKHLGIKYNCEHCDHQASSKYTLQTHVESIHLGIKYPCPFCEYQASYKNCLKEHIQAKHENISYPIFSSTPPWVVHRTQLRYIVLSSRSYRYWVLLESGVCW